MEPTIRPIAVGSALYQQELAIRDQVLRRPIGRSIRDDDLSGEDQYDHFGIFDGETLLGVLYRKPLGDHVAQIKQVAILEAHRKAGLGTRLFAFLLEDSRKQGYEKLVLDARADAAGFYQKMGFQKTGETKIIFRLPHFRMERSLTKEPAASR